MESDLQEIKELLQENNKILRGMRRAARFKSVLHLLYWIVIIGISIGAFYYLEPYLKDLIETYGVVIESVNKIKNTLP